MDRIARALWTACLFASAAFSKSPYLLSLDFAGDSLGRQSDTGLAPLIAHGDVKSVAGAADFGDSGYVQNQAFAHPKGAFTIEARLRPRAYAPHSTRYISDLASTATWDIGPNQGFFFRVGGGYLYPVLPRGAYAADSLYARSVSYSDDDRALLSRCLGDFGFGTKDGTTHWVDTYTDRCVDLDRWTYFVGVWDGQETRVYLNGFEATDSWRRNGTGYKPLFDSIATLTVGARYGGSYDQRHFDGSLDFIRILDTAMSETQIRREYRQTLGADSNAACRGRVLPISPEAGELCDSGCTFRFSIKPQGDCPDTGRYSSWHKGDSVEIEIGHDPDFGGALEHVIVGEDHFRMGGERKENLAGSSGPCFWRGRFKPGNSASAKRAADAAPEEWSEPKPFWVGPANPLAFGVRKWKSSFRLKAVAGGYLLEGLPDAEAPGVFRVDGRMAMKALPHGPGAWYLPLHGEHGLFLLKTAQGTSRLAL